MDDMEKAQHLDAMRELAGLENELKTLVPHSRRDSVQALGERMALERELADCVPTAPSELLAERICQQIGQQIGQEMGQQIGGQDLARRGMQTSRIGNSLLPLSIVAGIAAAALVLVGLTLWGGTEREQPGPELSLVPTATAQEIAPAPGPNDGLEGEPEFDPRFDALAGIKRYTPVSANRYVVGAGQSVHNMDDLGPMRVTVVRTMDEVEYKHPEKNRRVIISRPRDNLVLTRLESF